MLEPIVGHVLPSAWNSDEHEKITAFAGKLNALIISISAPTSTTASSVVNTRMNQDASNHMSTPRPT